MTVVLGLCGSGKSTLGMTLARDCEFFDEGIVPGLPNWDPFLDAVRAGQDCVVVEVAYLAESGREFLAQALEGTGAAITYICFENDLKTANANCVERARLDPTRDAPGNCVQNDRMSPTYTYPDGAEVRAMHRA